MTAFFDAIDRANASAFYLAIGGLLVAFAVLERVARR